MPRPMKHERSIAMYETILKLRTVEECVDFFEDLCAATELSAMEQRFDVASLLLEGRVYTEIMELTKASSATVSRVNRMLNYGHGCLGEVIARPSEAGGAAPSNPERLSAAPPGYGDPRPAPPASAMAAGFRTPAAERCPVQIKNEQPTVVGCSFFLFCRRRPC